MENSGLVFVFFGRQHNVSGCLCVCLSLCGGTKKPVWVGASFINMMITCKRKELQWFLWCKTKYGYLLIFWLDFPDCHTLESTPFHVTLRAPALCG